MYKPAFSEEVLYTLKELHALRPNLVSQRDINNFDHNVFLKVEEHMQIKHQSNIGMSRSVHTQAALLFYELCKLEGTTKTIRRNALVALLLFLFQHRYWLTLNAQEFFMLIRWIELSPPETMRETIIGTAKVIEKYWVKKPITD